MGQSMRYHNFKDLFERLSGKNLDAYLGVDASIPNFDFGDIMVIGRTSEIVGLVNYAVDLMSVDKFFLPYDTVAYSFRLEDGLEVVSVATTNQLAASGPREPNSISIYTAVMADNINIVADGLVNVYHDKSGGKLGLNLSTPRLHNVAGAEFNQEYAKFLKMIVGDFVGNLIPALTVMLDAQGVERRVTPPPERLNKARVKAGKSPIGEIHEIIIRVGDKEYAPSGHEIGGGHASPRLHWRRGHIRKLPNGSITNVRPCLVGALTNDVPKKPDYTIRG